MSPEAAIAMIGCSHLLQPPLAYVVTERLSLRAALARQPPLLARLLENMVLASIALPTTGGILLAMHAQEVAQPGAARSLAWVLSAFWSWRLARQCQAGALFRRGERAAALHLLLSGIFLVQGPGLALMLIWRSVS